MFWSTGAVEAGLTREFDGGHDERRDIGPVGVGGRSTNGHCHTLVSRTERALKNAPPHREEGADIGAYSGTPRFVIRRHMHPVGPVVEPAVEGQFAIVELQITSTPHWIPGARASRSSPVRRVVSISSASATYVAS